MPRHVKKPIEERFWSKIRKTDSCWIWCGFVSDRGYGQLLIANNKKDMAHRVSYRIHYGDIPLNACVLHTCDNRRCCNPDHLFIGTPHDNTQDMLHKERHRSKLSADDVRLIRKLRDIHNSTSSVALAKRFNVTKGHINIICRGDTWKHLVTHDGA